MASATEEMCFFCFDVLLDHLKSQESVSVTPPTCILRERSRHPLFVTWDIWREQNCEYELRGCIGCLSPLSLDKIGEYAITSSIHDKRFPSVTLDEVPKLRCSVSLLTNYERSKRWNEWEVGKHGIIIDFKVDGHNYNATYLPHVAPEQNWSVKETVVSLIRKAGYRSHSTISQDFLMKIKLTRYQSSKAYCTYDDYVKYRSSRSNVV